jgi:hypothetical protein
MKKKYRKSNFHSGFDCFHTFEIFPVVQETFNFKLRIFFPISISSFFFLFIGIAFRKESHSKNNNLPKSFLSHSYANKKGIYIPDFIDRANSNMVEGSFGQFPTSKATIFYYSPSRSWRMTVEARSFRQLGLGGGGG